MTVKTFEFSVSDLANSIAVTAAAEEHFRKQLLKSGKSAVRLSLKESGCTGFMYVLDEVEAGAADDAVKTLPNGVVLYIDPSNISALKDTEIDYAQEGLNRNLIFNNPNVKDACGCGESFSV